MVVVLMVVVVGRVVVMVVVVGFHRIGPLGRFDHRVAMSVCLCVCLCVCPFSCNFFSRVIREARPSVTRVIRAALPSY